MMNTNLLDLNNVILNIIGDYVKKDNFERKIMKEQHILNGGKITFHNFNYRPCLLCDKNGNYRKDEIKRYIFNYINIHILEIKACAKYSKSKLTIQNIRM